MTEMYIEEFFNSIKEQAKSMLERDGYHIPILFVLNSSGEKFVMSANYKTDEEKDAFFKNFRSTLKEMGATACIFIDEIWAKSLDAGKLREKELNDFLPIRKLEGKEEKLMITLNGFGLKRMVLISFDRTEDKKIILGKEKEFTDFTNNLIGSYFEEKKGYNREKSEQDLKRN